MNATAQQSKKESQAPVKRLVRKSNWLRTAEFVVVSIICIAVLESAFALAGIGGQEYLKPDPVSGFVIMPGKSITFRREGFSRTRFNSLGMADKERTLAKPAQTYRIAVLGDSMIEALQVDRSKSMCSLLETALNKRFTRDKNIEVLNFAVGAYNLGQMFLRLQSKVFEFQPDLVVLFVRHHATYDIIPQPQETFPKAARPYFFVGEGGNLVESRDIFQHWLKTAEAKRIQTYGWLREHSYIWGAIGKALEQGLSNWRQLLAGAHWGADVSNKQTAFALAPKQASETGAKSAPAPKVQSVFAEVQNGQNCIRCYYPIVDAIVNAMNNECVKHHCSFCIAYLPDNDEPAVLEHKLIKQSAAKRDIPLLDLGSDFERAKLADKESLYYVWHFSPRGHAVLADSIEKQLVASPWFQDAVSKSISRTK